MVWAQALPPADPRGCILRCDSYTRFSAGHSGILDRLRTEVPIVIVEHNLDLVLALSDRVYAMENGSVFHEGEAEELFHDLDYRKEILWL